MGGFLHLHGSSVQSLNLNTTPWQVWQLSGLLEVDITESPKFLQVVKGKISYARRRYTFSTGSDTIFQNISMANTRRTLKCALYARLRPVEILEKSVVVKLKSKSWFPNKEVWLVWNNTAPLYNANRIVMWSFFICLVFNRSLEDFSIPSKAINIFLDSCNFKHVMINDW